MVRENEGGKNTIKQLTKWQQEVFYGNYFKCKQIKLPYQERQAGF